QHSFNTIRKEKPDQSKNKQHLPHEEEQMPQKKSSSIQKHLDTQCQTKLASDNSSSHYRVLKEHTPTGTTHIGRSPASFVRFGVVAPSPAQLFQRTRPSCRSATLGLGSDRECLAVPRWSIEAREATLFDFSGAVSAEPGFLSPSAPSRESVRGGAVAR
ncbi:hypothetical protein, partial [Gordonia sp. NPDC003422]